MKKVLAMMMAILLVVMCVGCAGNSTAADNKEAVQTEPVSSNTNDGAEENALSGTVSFLCGETDEEQVTVVKQAIKDFEAANPGCKIELVLSGQDDREQTILTELYAGGKVDIITVDAESIGAYIKNGLLYPLDDLIASIGEEDFVEGSRIVYNGHDYAMPYATWSQMLYVRTDLLEEKGLSIPKTWDELLYAAEQLTEDGRYGMCLPAGTNNCTELNFTMFSILGGTSIFDKDCMPQLNSQRVKDTLKFYTDLAKYCPEGITSYGYGDMISAFVSGKCAMTLYQGRVIARVNNEAPDLIGKYAVVPVPTSNDLSVDDIQVGGYNYFAIGKGCENPELAMAFLKYLCSGEPSVDFAMSAAGHINPALHSVVELLNETLDSATDGIAVTSGDYIKASINHATASNINYEAVNAGCMEDGVSVKTGVLNTNYAYIRSYNILSEMIQRVLINGESIDVVCEEAQEKLVNIIEENS